MGDFNGATFSFTPATPIPIGPFVYLLRMGGGFTVDPIHIEASARIGAGAAVQGTAPVNVNGLFEMDFPRNGAPANFKMSGTVDIFFFEIGNGFLQFQTDGYAAFGGQLGPFEIEPLFLEASTSGFVDAGAGQFGAELSGTVEICIDVELARPCAGAGADVALSNAGFAACAKLKVVKEFTGGVRFPWRDFGPEILANPAAASSRPRRAHRDPLQHRRLPRAASAAGVGACRAGRRHRRERAARRTQPHDRPDGQRRRAAGDRHGAGRRRGSQWRAAHGHRLHRYVGEPAGHLPGADQPEAGDWTIVPNQGSPAITQTLAASGYKPATVKAELGGKGRKRWISYRMKNLGHGQRVVFAERGKFGTNIVGSTSKARGKLKFTIADAQGGRRRVLAMVEKDEPQDRPQDDWHLQGAASGAAREGQAAAGHAQGQERDRQVARRARRSALLDHPAPRHGTSLGRFAGRKARKFASPTFRRDEKLKIAVYGVSNKLRRGPAAKKNLPAARR